MLDGYLKQGQTLVFVIEAPHTLIAKLKVTNHKGWKWHF